MNSGLSEIRKFDLAISNIKKLGNSAIPIQPSIENEYVHKNLTEKMESETLDSP
mgnify:CR=1 FL=1